MAERKTIEAIGAPEAAGPYSHAVAHGGVLYCSGQVPIDPRDRQARRGRTRRAGEALPDQPRGRLRRRRDEPRPRADGQRLRHRPRRRREINAAYAEHFDADPPARAMIEVAGLPLGAGVEIAAVVALD